MAAEEKTGDGFGAPASDWFLITPHDTNELSIRPRALYLPVAGAVSMVSRNGNTMTGAFAAGYHPLRPVIVKDTGTDSITIYGLI